MYLARALLAAIGLAANVRALARGDPHRSGVRFLDWALMNDEPGWGRVLDENVKVPGRPPYADVFAANGEEIVPRSAADGALPVSARSVVARLAYRYGAVGSLVRYAVAVLQRSFMCFTARHLAFQMQYVSLLLLLQPDSLAAIMTAASELKDNLVQIVDKLAVAGGTDLSLVLETYWQTIVVMRHDVASQVRMAPLPESVKRTVDRLYERFVDYAADRCSGYRLTVEFFDDIDVRVNNTLIVDSVLNTTLTERELVDVGQAHSRFLRRFYADLNYSSMSPTMWKQVFYASNRGEAKDELDKINPPINK